MIFGESADIRFALDLPKIITFEPPPCIWFIRKIQKPKKRMKGRMVISSESKPELPVP